MDMKNEFSFDQMIDNENSKNPSLLKMGQDEKLTINKVNEMDVKISRFE
jgi:hypothetical protein